MLPILEEAEDIVSNLVELMKDDDEATDHAFDAARALDKLIPFIRERV